MDLIEKKFIGVMVFEELYKRGKKQRLSFSKVLNEALIKRFEDEDREYNSAKILSEQYDPIVPVVPVEEVIQIEVNDTTLE